MSAPTMPEWAPADGPWCLKQWITRARHGEQQTVVTCLLGLDHEGECRDQDGVYRTAELWDIPAGQLKMKDVPASQSQETQ